MATMLPAENSSPGPFDLQLNKKVPMPIILFFYLIQKTSMLYAGRCMCKPLQLSIGFVANL
jgi:hypothetical protein